MMDMQYVPFARLIHPLKRLSCPSGMQLMPDPLFIFAKNSSFEISLGLERDREKNLTRFASPYQAAAVHSTDGLDRVYNSNPNSVQYSVADSSMQLDAQVRSPDNMPPTPTSAERTVSGSERKKKKGIKAFFTKLGGGSVRSACT